jgi:hypothetical protein
MSRSSTSRSLLCSLIFACAGATSLPAQEPPTPASSQAKPAARSLPPVNAPQDDSEQTPAGQLQPDATPLTGILAPSLGTPQLEHSFVMVGAQVGSTIQSGGFNAPGWYANNYFLGNLNLIKNWRRAVTSVNYSGGGYVSTNDSQRFGAYQNLSFLQDFHSARWDFSLVDVFAYLPQSQFGFGGGTNLGLPGTGGTPGVPIPPINGGPNQDIFSAVGPRYTNTAAAQANYTLTARDSITASASYGILRFTDSGNFNTDTYTAGLGFNHQLTKADTIGVVYNFGAYHYSGNPQAYGSQSIGLSYGRKITGRLAFQVSGGPQFNTYRIPVNGSTSVVSGYGSANLSYGLQNGAITATYIHGLSNGSGVLLGSQLDQVTVSASRKLGRVWTGFANLGFSRNSPLGDMPDTDSASYNNWFVGGGVSRPFGRAVQFAASYTANFQKTKESGCTTGDCTSDLTQHMFTLSLQWHTRPFVLR